MVFSRLVLVWNRDTTGNTIECSGEHVVTCTANFDADSWNFDGVYTVEATNFASGNTQTTDSETFTVTLYKDVTVSTTPSGMELVVGK